MGLFDSIGKMVGNIKGEQQAGKRAAQAERDHWKRIEAGNWEPEYASQHAPEYQQTKSPVARAYLESFLTGTNQDAVQGTRLGSSGPLGAKAQAQAGFNQAYGGWDKLRADSASELSDNERFKPTPITRPVREQSNETALRYPWAVRYEKKLGRSLTPDEIEVLARWRDGKGKGVFDTKAKLMDAWLETATPQQLEEAFRSKRDLGGLAIVAGK